MRRLVRVGSKFLVVGAVSTLIEIAVFNLMLAAGADPITAKVVASLVALINAYFGNREWTFRASERRGRKTEIALFLLANLLCTLLGAGIVAAGVALFPGAGVLMLNIVNLFSIAAVVVVRFALYTWVVFPNGLAEPRAG